MQFQPIRGRGLRFDQHFTAVKMPSWPAKTHVNLTKRPHSFPHRKMFLVQHRFPWAKSASFFY
jgi:hypothetical protein